MTDDAVVQDPINELPLCACGAGPHPEKDDRCARGHVVRGNETAKKSGVRQFEIRGIVALPDMMRLSIEEFREAVVADRGGAGELSTLEQAYIRRLSECEATARLLASDLATRGLMTPRGRVRNSYSRWLETLAVWDKLAQRIGTDRRARQIPTLRDYLETAAAAVKDATVEDRGDAD